MPISVLRKVVESAPTILTFVTSLRDFGGTYSPP